jgi:predicted RNA binding protein YcfA (HicA-like mRNA interferase family)
LTEKLPLLSGRKVAQAFVRLGWQVARQKGSHIVLVKPGYIASLSVPDHREVARGTLRSLLRAADVELSEFLDAAE